MGQPNMWYTGPILDVQLQQVLPENNHTMVPPPGIRTTSDPRYLPENHGQLPYVNTQYNSERCNTLTIPSPNTTGPMEFDFDPVAVRNSSRLVHGGQPVQPLPAGGRSWNRACGASSVQDMGRHGYQVAGMSGNSQAFLRPHQGSRNLYHPLLPAPAPSLQPPPPYILPVQAQNMDSPVHLPSTSHRHSTITSTAYSVQSDADPGPSFVGPAAPHGMRVYEARRQQLMVDSMAGHRSFTHLRVLPEDAFLALGEQIGNAESCLSRKLISDHLKTRTFGSFRHHSEDLMPADEEPNFCVICQMEFEDQEKIGMLDCCHEYHVECIKKWLVVKNNCPVCKSIALR